MGEAAVLPERDQCGEAAEEAQEAGIDEGKQRRERTGAGGGMQAQFACDAVDGLRWSPKTGQVVKRESGP